MRIDGRTLDHKTLEHLRKTAVRRVEVDKESVTDVMASMGFCRTTYYKWKRAYANGGEKALDMRVAKGPTPKLDERQRSRVRRWIVGKDPRQYGFDFGLWTRKIVQRMIGEKMGVNLSIGAVGALLASLELTPQKPLRRAYERDPKAIKEWQEKEFPAIRRRAKRTKASIFFLDETGVRSDAALGRSYGLKGHTPVVKTSGRRQSVNAISAVNARGAFWYTVYTERLNAHTFVKFLKDFMRSRRRRRVILVLDSMPAHKAKLVQEYVNSLRGRLALEFLPGYAPELNPDEHVWRHLKQNGVSKKPLCKKESLRHRVVHDLARIKRKPRLVRSFFNHPDVAYAAA